MVHEWSLRIAEAEDRDAVLALPGERWEESDTLSVEYTHILADSDKAAYICLGDNAIIGFIAVYMPPRNHDLVLLHKRIATSGFRGLDMLRRLLHHAIHDLATDHTLQNLVLTVPQDSYVLLKNTFLGSCAPLFNRKSLMLMGNMSYVRDKLEAGTVPESKLVFVEGEENLRRLIPTGSVPPAHTITVRGDPVYLADLLANHVPFQVARTRSLLTLTRQPDQVGGLSIGTVKMESNAAAEPIVNNTRAKNNVLHVDVHSKDYRTVQAHVVQHLTHWAKSSWSSAIDSGNFYLEINYNNCVELYCLLSLTAKLGLMPRDESLIKNLVTLHGRIADLNLGHQ